MQRSDTARSDQDFDPQSITYYCGDVTSARLAKDFQGEQRELKENFLRVLKDLLPQGARLSGDGEALYSAFRFTVTYGENAISSTYANEVKRKFPLAFVQRKGQKDIWIVPYRKPSTGSKVADILSIFLFLFVILCVYLFEQWF